MKHGCRDINWTIWNFDKICKRSMFYRKNTISTKLFDKYVSNHTSLISPFVFNHISIMKRKNLCFATQSMFCPLIGYKGGILMGFLKITECCHFQRMQMYPSKRTSLWIHWKWKNADIIIMAPINFYHIFLCRPFIQQILAT